MHACAFVAQDCHTIEVHALHLTMPLICLAQQAGMLKVCVYLCALIFVHVILQMIFIVSQLLHLLNTLMRT